MERARARAPFVRIVFLRSRDTGSRALMHSLHARASYASTRIPLTASIKNLMFITQHNKNVFPSRMFQTARTNVSGTCAPSATNSTIVRTFYVRTPLRPLNCSLFALMVNGRAPPHSGGNLWIRDYCERRKARQYCRASRCCGNRFHVFRRGVTSTAAASYFPHWRLSSAPKRLGFRFSSSIVSYNAGVCNAGTLKIPRAVYVPPARRLQRVKNAPTAPSSCSRSRDRRLCGDRRETWSFIREKAFSFLAALRCESIVACARSTPRVHISRALRSFGNPCTASRIFSRHPLISARLFLRPSNLFLRSRYRGKRAIEVKRSKDGNQAGTLTDRKCRAVGDLDRGYTWLESR